MINYLNFRKKNFKGYGPFETFDQIRRSQGERSLIYRISPRDN